MKSVEREPPQTANQKRLPEGHAAISQNNFSTVEPPRIYDDLSMSEMMPGRHKRQSEAPPVVAVVEKMGALWAFFCVSVTCAYDPFLCMPGWCNSKGAVTALGHMLAVAPKSLT